MRSNRQFLTYGVAIGSTAIALLLSMWLEPLLAPIISPLFYIAIIVTARYGGFRPGSVAVVLSMLAIEYFFVPVHQLWPAQPGNILRLSIFLLVATVINLLTSYLQESKKKIERLNQQLIQQNADILHDSATQLRLALSAARMGMWDWNLVTGEIKWSPEHALLLGLEPGTFDGKYETFDARVHPEDRQGLNKALQQALQTKSIYRHEFRVIWPDGSLHWVEGRGQSFDDEAGQAVRTIGTVANIDDRKRTETLLHQQVEQQRLLLEMTQRIRQSLNLQDILQTTVEQMREFLQCDRTIVFQFAPDWAGQVVVESVKAGCMALLPLQIHDPCIGEQYVEPFKKGLITVKSDIYNSGVSPCHIEFLANLQVKANLVAPILVGDELWGLLAAHHCTAPRQWQDYEIESIRQIAIQAGIAIQQADLFEQLQTELKERQQVEIALQETQIQLQRQLAEIEAIYQSAPIGLSVLDSDLRFVRINQRLAEMNGFSVAAHIGRTVAELLPNLADTAEQLLRSILATGQPLLNVEIFGETPSRPGVQRVWLGHFLPLKDGDRIIGISNVCEEITERKQAEIAIQKLNAELEQRVIERTRELTDVNARLLVLLLEKEQAYQLVKEQAQLLDLAHDSIITWDLNSVITFWNRGAESMYGWTKAEAFGQETHSLLKTQFPQPFTEIETELLAKGYWEGELIHFTKDDRLITVSSRWVVQKDDAFRAIKILEINNDISERKQAEATIREAERRWRSLLDNVQSIVVGFDRAGNVNYANPFFFRLTGYTSQEVLGKNWFENFLPSSIKISIKSAFSELLNHNNYPYYQNPILTKSGEEKLIAWNNTVLQDLEENIIGTISIGEDITERQKIEKIKDEFISIVSHELRTPLTAIQMSLGLLESGIYDKKPEKSRRLIEIAILDTNRLVNLVNDILDLERLESGSAVLEKTVCKATDLIQQAINGIQQIADRQQISLAFTPTDAEVWAAADAIIQTLTNLLSNAIKFSPAHSTVRISIEHQTEFVLFRVSDRGRGIPADKLELIFGRFQQVDASDSREKGGTGLGLAICRSIIERHNGKIWAESILGEGSTFFFTLPLPTIQL